MSDSIEVPNPTDRDIEILSQRWANGDGPGMSIREYLQAKTGWDWNEYAYWAETGRVMP